MLYYRVKNIIFSFHEALIYALHQERGQGRIQDFKLGGGALKKIAPSGGRHEHFWGISREKSRFYAKESYFAQLLF